MRLIRVAMVLSVMTMVVACSQEAADSQTAPTTPPAAGEQPAATTPADESTSQPSQDLAALKARRAALKAELDQKREAFKTARDLWKQKTAALNDARGKNDTAASETLTKELDDMKATYQASIKAWKDVNERWENLETLIKNAG